jgi:tetratricopeptide (TPR) repeat protein
MSLEKNELEPGLTDLLADRGYWPARAARLMDEGRYADAVALCKEQLLTDLHTTAGRAMYGLALYRAEQFESAAEQFYVLLSRDPDHLVALKYLGDIKFAAGDELAALTYYHRIQQLDPYGAGLACDLSPRSGERTRTITLIRPGEESARPERSRTIPFYTETMGDLYLDQGHPRLAAEVYRTIYEHNASPRLAEKLGRAEKLMSRKER